jgi:DNA-3-methyladenine glycosylase I
MKNLQRCFWCTEKKMYEEYHDEEWGFPVNDDQTLFEMLILEGAQAGLSWWTVLQKRDEYRKVFFDFSLKKILALGNQEEKKKVFIEKAMQNEGIIRNRLKIHSVFINAEKFSEVQKEWGSFSSYLCSFTKGKVIYGDGISVISKNELSDTISKDLKKRGFKFIGSTIIYAYLQAVGVVNDHRKECFRFKK